MIKNLNTVVFLIPISNIEKMYEAGSDVIDLVNKMKYLGDVQLKTTNECEFSGGSSLSDYNKKFYKEIFRNAIRFAKENKSVLRVDIDSLLSQKILNGKLTSEGLVLSPSKSPSA